MPRSFRTAVSVPADCGYMYDLCLSILVAGIVISIGAMAHISI